MHGCLLSGWKTTSANSSCPNLALLDTVNTTDELFRMGTSLLIKQLLGALLLSYPGLPFDQEKIHLANDYSFSINLSYKNPSQIISV